MQITGNPQSGPTGRDAGTGCKEIKTLRGKNPRKRLYNTVNERDKPSVGMKISVIRIVRQEMRCLDFSTISATRVLQGSAIRAHVARAQ